MSMQPLLMPNSMLCLSWKPNGLTKPISTLKTAMVAQAARVSMTLDRFSERAMTAMIILKSMEATIDMEIHRATAVIAKENHQATAVTAMEDRLATKIHPHRSNATIFSPATVAHLSMVTMTNIVPHHQAMVKRREATDKIPEATILTDMVENPTTATRARASRSKSARVILNPISSIKLVGHQEATAVVMIASTLMIAKSLVAPHMASRIKGITMETIFSILTVATTRAMITATNIYSSTKELVDTRKDTSTSPEFVSKEMTTGMMYRTFPGIALATTLTKERLTSHPRKSRDTNM